MASAYDSAFAECMWVAEKQHSTFVMQIRSITTSGTENTKIIFSLRSITGIRYVLTIILVEVTDFYFFRYPNNLRVRYNN